MIFWFCLGRLSNRILRINIQPLETGASLWLLWLDYQENRVLLFQLNHTEKYAQKKANRKLKTKHFLFTEHIFGFACWVKISEDILKYFCSISQKIGFDQP